MEELTGYQHFAYAHSLSGFGTPRELPHCGGGILERPISGTPYKDAMGCYPLFACGDWSRLHEDLDDIGDDLISLSLVTDPFGEYDVTYLHGCFKDVVIPFKQHFIVDLSQLLSRFVCTHHTRYARKALLQLHIERCEDPTQFINEWVDLYAGLIERHNIKGILAFSTVAFTMQLRVPGIVVFRAVYRDKTVGMLLWYVHEEVGYYHLGAYSPLGYDLHASFALFWFVIEYFAANGLRWLNLGAGAGVRGDGADGLTRFKRGWSTGTRTAYFCGRVFNRAKYSEIVKAKGISATDYFPAYRKGEFD
jgi:hypothetical protein